MVHAEIQTCSQGVGRLRSIALQPETKAIRREIRASLGEQRLLLRVDRLEPSKNILRGFLAYELFLRRNPGWRGRVRFLALLTPSREELTVILDRTTTEGRREALAALRPRLLIR